VGFRLGVVWSGGRSLCFVALLAETSVDRATADTPPFLLLRGVSTTARFFIIEGIGLDPFPNFGSRQDSQLRSQSTKTLQVETARCFLSSTLAGQ
jgi:hypothetical protein